MWFHQPLYKQDTIQYCAGNVGFQIRMTTLTEYGDTKFYREYANYYGGEL